MIGESFGHYRIIEKIGSGGMGVVYRATDSRLGRDVALKLLPDAFASDAERMARFQREARLLSSLNHSNIATIYGLEESGEARAIAMELAEGPSLADRLLGGPIPIDEALSIAKQVAEALEAAHEKGIIHRDLKPANVKVTADGKVKVLDFGLAKALAGDAGEAAASPTISDVATRDGVILGTAAYMSPEQARGKPLDRRTDIWSFGCLLYEMLTGRMAFRGDTVSDTLVRILGSEPDWEALPAETPANVRAVLARCLRKDVRERLRDIGDARIELTEPVPAASLSTAGREMAGPRQPIWRHPLPLVFLVLTFVFAGLAGWLAWRPRGGTGGPGPVSRVSVNLPSGRQLIADRGAIALSPDGRDVVFAAREERGRPGPADDVTLLYRRSFEDGVLRPIGGTDIAARPIFSPDGDSIAFLDRRSLKLKRVSLAGGAPLDVSGEGLTRYESFSWLGEDALLCGRQSVIIRIPAEGGEPETLVKRTQMELQKGEFYLECPQVLPNKADVLFGVRSFDPSQSSIWVLAKGAAKRLTVRGLWPRYLPTGHLIFLKPAQDRAEWTEDWYDAYAAPFDLSRLEVTGKAVLVLEGVRYMQMAVAQNGTLAYNGSHEGRSTRELVSIDRQGLAEPLGAGWIDTSNLAGPRISPDGARVLMWGGPKTIDARVHIFDLKGRSTRILSPAASGWAAWTSDGKQVVFNHQAADGKSNWNLYWRPADGSGSEERLTNSPNLQQPLFVTADGHLVYQEEAVGTTGHDLWILPLRGERTPKPLRRTTANEHLASLSPNGRSLAFASDESGRDEIWVCPFPACDRTTQVSTGGGTGPVWSPDGQTLFFRDSAGSRLFAAPVTWSLAPVFGTPTVTSGEWLEDFLYGRNYDVMPDGKHLVLIASTSTAGSEITVVLNWFEELKRKMQGK